MVVNLLTRSGTNSKATGMTQLDTSEILTLLLF